MSSSRDALDGEHRAVDALEHVDHLLQRRRIGVDDVVAEDDGEGLVANQRSASPARRARGRAVRPAARRRR